MFDYAYSWGVLHHSPNLGQSLAEMMRVTKPGGEFGIMLYNRRSFLHWYMDGVPRGLPALRERIPHTSAVGQPL